MKGVIVPSCLCGECRVCKCRPRMKKYRKLYPDIIRQRRQDWAKSEKGRASEAQKQKRYRSKHKAQIAVTMREYSVAHPVETKARSAVNNAIKAGKLVRGPCEVCGSTKRIHGHHRDYSKPLEVQWLCASHHKAAHRKEEV